MVESANTTYALIFHFGKTVFYFQGIGNTNLLKRMWQQIYLINFEYQIFKRWA